MIIDSIVWCIIVYFIVFHGSYLVLNMLALRSMRHVEQTRVLAELPHVHTGLEPPISLLLVTHDDVFGIVESVRNLLDLNYPQFEVIVINDGSQDGTMEALIDTFDLLPFPEAYRIQLATQNVNRIYRSIRHPNLRVLDKTAGGRADALNAGINASRYPLACTIDRHVALERDCLHRLVMPFLSNAGTVAAIGAVRVKEDDLSTKRLLSRLQIVQYLRSNLFTSLGWSTLNALLIAPPGMRLLRKTAVIDAGGYRTDTLSEEMELIMRMHRAMQKQQQPYQISFVDDAIGRQEPLIDLPSLKSKSMFAQQMLADSMRKNVALLSGRKTKPGARLAFLFLTVFEWFGPLIEAASYTLIAIAFLMDIISPEACAAFFAIAIGMGILLSISSLLLEEISSHAYQRPGTIGGLMIAAVIENLGYRQMNAYWRSLGLIKWLLRD
jgi:cellulose synthase/poly-beta-1,6-N-acetylglucosamine synthase-like glycosyltransferase